MLHVTCYTLHVTCYSSHVHVFVTHTLSGVLMECGEKEEEQEKEAIPEYKSLQVQEAPQPRLQSVTWSTTVRRRRRDGEQGQRGRRGYT